MRDFLNKFGYYIVAAAVVIVGIVLYLHFSHATSARRTDDFSSAFYIDEETGDESVHPITDAPPLIGVSGKPTVVRAIKYTCDGGKTSQILYFFKYTEDVQSQLQALPLNDPVADLRRSDLVARGQMVRAPAKDSDWVPEESEKGQALTKLPTCPDGKSSTIVYPQKR